LYVSIHVTSHPLVTLATLLIVVATFSLILTVKLLARRISKRLSRAVDEKDVEETYRILSGKRLLIRFINKNLISKALDLLFYRAEFEKFAYLIETLKIRDDRALILDKEVDTLALDIETEIAFEKRPRELGIVALRSRDWSIAFRLRIAPLETFTELYGIEPQEFLRAFLSKGNFKVVVGHNIYEFDAKILEEWGVDLSDKSFIDTYTLSLIILPEAASHSLEYLCNLFKISYSPHRADEDAYASAMLLPRLLRLAEVKGVLKDVIEADFEPIRGLREVEIPLVEAKLPLLEEKHVEDRRVEVVVDATEYAEAWYPYLIDQDALKSVRPSSTAEWLALITIRSFVAGGGKDPNKLAVLRIPYRDYSKALTSILGRVVKLNTSALSTGGIAVEYRYLKDYIKALKDKGLSQSEIVFRGAFLLRVYYYEEYKRILEWASKSFSKVVMETLFPFESRLENVTYRYPSGRERPVVIVEEGIDKSPRHRAYLGRLLAGLFAEKRGKFIVVVSSSEEEWISKLVATSTGTRVIVETYRGYMSTELLERIFRLSKAGYSTAIFSTRTLLRKFKRESSLLFLKAIAEIVMLAGGKACIINTDSETLLDPSFSRVLEKANIKPLENVDIRIPCLAFKSLGEAVESAEKIVESTWGFRLRPYQRRCVARMLAPYVEGRHFLTKPLTIVILPTGSGKSVIFQSVAKLLRNRIGGTTVVVSPLLALIEDQVNSLRRRGVKVCSITSATGKNIKRYISDLARGEYEIVYITPEQFQKEEVRRSFEKVDLNYLIIDEIHTMYKWGKTFRPSYSYLAHYLRRRREEGFWIPIAGFTATLPQRGLEEVVKMLTGRTSFNLEEIDSSTDFDTSSQSDFYEVKVLKGPVLRENIEIDIVEVPSDHRRLKILADVVKRLSEWADMVSKGDTWIGLVYTGFVRSSKMHENAPYIAKYLEKALGEKVLYFHGQMSDKKKKRVLNTLYAVSQGKARRPRIVVATKAFGMGVDIPNIRWVLHYMMPESIEDYYQEIGRGGRDGLNTQAIMLYSPGYDYNRRLMLIKGGLVDPGVVVSVYRWLKAAENGAVIPLFLLTLALTRKFKLKTLLSHIYSHRRLPEEAENTIEKSLGVLSDLGVLDYDLVYTSFVLLDQKYKSADIPGYPISTHLSPIGPPSRPQLYIVAQDYLEKEPLRKVYYNLFVSEKGFTVEREAKQGAVRLTGRDIETVGIRINYINKDLQEGEIYKAVSEGLFYSMFSLYIMDNYSRKILATPTPERNTVARMVIQEYLSGSLDELYHKLLSDKREKAIQKYSKYLKYYEKLIANKTLYLSIRRINKRRISDLTASLTLLYIMEHNAIPTNIAIIVPYGYKSIVQKFLRNKLETLEMPLIEPYILGVSKPQILYNLEEVASAVKGVQTLFILSTNRYMYALANRLRYMQVSSAIYEIRCIKR